MCWLFRTSSKYSVALCRNSGSLVAMAATHSFSQDIAEYITKAWSGTSKNDCILRNNIHMYTRASSTNNLAQIPLGVQEAIMDAARSAAYSLGLYDMIGEAGIVSGIFADTLPIFDNISARHYLLESYVIAHGPYARNILPQLPQETQEEVLKYFPLREILWYLRFAETPKSAARIPSTLRRLVLAYVSENLEEAICNYTGKLLVLAYLHFAEAPHTIAGLSAIYYQRRRIRTVAAPVTYLAGIAAESFGLPVGDCSSLRQPYRYIIASKNAAFLESPKDFALLLVTNPEGFASLEKIGKITLSRLSRASTRVQVETALALPQHRARYVLNTLGNAEETEMSEDDAERIFALIHDEKINDSVREDVLKFLKYD